MDLLAYIFGGDMRAGPGPTDDFWYQDAGSSVVTPSGMRVTSDTAQMVSAWYRGRDILATVLAMLPLPLYRRLPNDGGSEPATDQGLYEVIHDRPNGWQDSFQWRRGKMYDLVDCGWSYDWIIPGARGAVDQLHPIKPALVTPKQIAAGLNKGRYLFDVRDEKTGRTETYTQDEVFYLRGAEGKGILERARSSIGTAMATEQFVGRIYGTGTLTSGYIKNPGTLDPEAGRRMALSFLTKPGEWHLPKILEQGSEFIESKMSPEDAQMLDSRKFSVDDMARWLGVPRMMLESSDPSYGNAEQFDDNFITYSMGPWLSMFEFGINGQLVIDPRQYYAEFTRDAIVRGKFLDRAQGNVLLVNAGIVSVDEVRAKEGKNKRGGKADDLREPQNITGKPAAGGKPAPVSPENTKAIAIANETAARVLRKEAQAVQKAAVRHAADEDAFVQAVTEFYAKHVELVMGSLQMAQADAETYCAGQAHQIVNGEWLKALELWQTAAYAAGVAAIALEEVA